MTRTMRPLARAAVVGTGLGTLGRTRSATSETGRVEHQLDRMASVIVRDSDESWRAEAACHVDRHPGEPDLMFPYDSDAAGIAAAKAVCHWCPVRLQCLDWRMAQRPSALPFGVYAGMTPNELANLKRSRDRAARPST